MIWMGVQQTTNTATTTSTILAVADADDSNGDEKGEEEDTGTKDRIPFHELFDKHGVLPAVPRLQSGDWGLTLHRGEVEIWTYERPPSSRSPVLRSLDSRDQTLESRLQKNTTLNRISEKSSLLALVVAPTQKTRSHCWKLKLFFPNCPLTARADDTDNHVDDHDGDLHPCWQQAVGLIPGTVGVVVELQMAQLSEEEVISELHL
ncbi:hypothetical protein EYF80_009717 [Liparis tanakae]|uniref:Uncharacterized protein n=1 Tax=Liparis tanakae TaxID=230148 RepID=A0A4Z2IQ77_9TELE|nr:hypothetical protein EYF80_009717 [Liparis tanakae]